MLNEADIMGELGYSPKFTNRTLFKLENNIIRGFENSTKYIITSKPAYIVLNTSLINKNTIITGETYPIQFSLYDEYDHIYIDESKYYSSLTIKMILIEKNNMNIEYDEDIYESDENRYKLVDNVCSFINGKKKLL